jgi:RHS repeat-associated protein
MRLHQERASFMRTRALTFLLLASMMIGSFPPQVGATVFRQAVVHSSSFALLTQERVAGWLDFLGMTQGRRSPAPPSGSRGITPGPAQSKEEKRLRASSIRLNTTGNVVLKSREPMLFSAIPLDSQGNTIHGLDVEWESSDRQVIFIRKDGQAIAGKPGNAKISARVGSAKESVGVTVVEGSKEDFGGKKKENSRRPERKIARNLAGAVRPQLVTKANRKQYRAHSTSNPSRLVNPAMLLRDPMEDPLPDEETGSLYQPNNNVGLPPGTTRPGGATPPVAIEGQETGDKNFTFGLPIVNLPGRGIDLPLAITYNSLLYNKSTPFGSTWLTYDVDSGWPAPGFRIGYGQIEDQGGFGFTLSEADGTRHGLTYTSPNTYDSNDGTFLRFIGGSGWGTLFYPDGVRVSYGAAGGGVRSYPTQITDRNGNYVQISYEGGVGPRINSIKDTLERYVRFYYAANGDLLSITAPGLTGNPDREIMRFFYDDISFNPSNLFDPSINVDMPGSSHVLKYVFLSNSVETNDAHTGYRFDYSAYGMIYQIVQFRGMVLNASLTAVANEGTQSATSTYNYPGTPVNTSTGLLDVPTYSTRTDDWAGRTTGMNGNPSIAPFYTFSVNETSGISTVTAPNGAVTESHAIINPGQWNDGLIGETFLDKQGSTALSHTVIDWEQGAGGSPRVSQVRKTNDAGQTKATVLTYAASYNNVAAVSERNFTTDGSVSATELRRTETTYVTSTSYINRRLIHLPSTIKVFAGGSSTPASRVDYTYDDYGTNHANLTPRDPIIMHDPAFDPFQQTVETNCRWECFEWEFHNCYDWQWVCDYYNPYDPSTDFRGNVTSVTTYPDAATGANPITRSTTYDIAGNVTTEQSGCCQQKVFTYSGASSTHDYAYPISVTVGSGSTTLTASVTFDYNTALPATTTDENGQVTTNYYNADSLRVNHIDYPDGGVTAFQYSEALTPDAAGRYHFYFNTSTKLDSPSGTPRWVDSIRYFDGRGNLKRTFNSFTAGDGWSAQDIEYDVMGRAYRNSNPYFSPGYTTGPINPDGFWTTTTFDHLGRITQVTMPRGDDNNSLVTTSSAQYNGVFTTATDQAGKSRRQKADALGRVVRVDEPDLSGNLGPTGSPSQATNYTYDVLGNLIHVEQGAQHRYFKYDSLSRLIRERHVEHNVNSSYDLNDPLTGNSSWSRKVEYNSDGLVTDAYDPRGVHSQFFYDGLNRLKDITYSDSTPAAHYYYDSQALPPGAPNYDHGYATGRLIAMTYGSATSTTGNYFGYDKMGRVVTQKQVTGANTYSLSYAYNLGGLLTSETYPSGRTLTYSFNQGARLSQVSDSTTTFANGFSYAAHGGLKSEIWGNGAVHSRSYNRRLQTSEVKLKQSATGSDLQRFNYSYGQVTQSTGSVDTSKNNGQIGRIDSFINGNATKEWDQRFVYDSLARLSTAAEYQQGNNNTVSWQTQYTYDRYGNRFQSGGGNFGVNFTPVLSTDTVEATNRFVTNGATPTTYDAAGNITTDTKFRGMNYSYDANGRQTFAERTDHTSGQSSVYDCAGQRVQITTGNGVTRTMVYDIFGQNVADYAGTGSSLERENIYRGGQLLSIVEMSGASASAPSTLSATPSGSSVTLSWTAAAGATNYRVERRGAGGSYSLVGTTTSTGFTDNGVSSGNAYLYKVCAANGQNSCVSNFSNLALGTTITFATDPTIVTSTQDPSGATVTKAKAAHITELRTAVNTVRGLAGLSAATWTNPSITVGSTIRKDDVRDLREKLDEALIALAIQISSYTDPILAGTPNGTTIKGVHITELRQRVASGTGTEGSGGGTCYKSLSQFVKDFYQGVLKRQPNPTELSVATNTLIQAQLQGQAQLMSAAQNLGTTLFNSSEYAGLNTSNAQYITDLYLGYLQRTPDTAGYDFWLGILNGGETRPNIRQGFALSTEFQNNVMALCTPAGTSSGVKYVLSDTQGSARAIMNNGAFGSSTVISRHDYQPFGEEIWAGTGLRTTTQGYNATDKLRQKYALTERDETTGLDHTWWRKLDSFAGRWTSPDPYNGSAALGEPQSFNRYHYVQNDPVNLIDPSGLYWAIDWGSCRINWVWVPHIEGGGDWFDRGEICNLVWIDDRPFFDPGPGPGGGGPIIPQQPPKKDEKKKCKQDKTGGDRADIQDLLGRAGVGDSISNVRSAGPKNPEGIIFEISNRQSFVNTLNANPNFRHNTPFGGEHTAQVGGNLRNTGDYRSFTSKKDSLGTDSTGQRRSLQVDVGPAGTVPGNPQAALGYADLDCDNPAQDLASGVKHGAPILFRKLKGLFGR